jgi:CelD/BcsL family acetyltransferase involved in cellulose biosynthesis
MGPVFDPLKISTAEMIGAAVGLLEERYDNDYIELIGGSLDRAEMRALGFQEEPIPTFRAPLHPGDEKKTLAQLKDSARRNIRRGMKLGLVTRFETDIGFVDEAYDQMREVFVRGGNAIPFGKKRVLEYFRHMKESGALVAISVYLPGGTTSIATGLFTISGDELRLWQWAHRTRFRWYRPTELMTWAVMAKAIEAGCTTFDLMGLGDFKQKFGAVVDDSQCRWMRSRHAWLTQLRHLAEKSFRWQQAIRGQLARCRLRLYREEPSDGARDE